LKIEFYSNVLERVSKATIQPTCSVSCFTEEKSGKGCNFCFIDQGLCKQGVLTDMTKIYSTDTTNRIKVFYTNTFSVQTVSEGSRIKWRNYQGKTLYQPKGFKGINFDYSHHAERLVNPKVRAQIFGY
jgi:hypothetical protein